MRKLGIDEWVVKTVNAMYHSSKSLNRLNGIYSEDFPVNVGVHQGSVLSPHWVHKRSSREEQDENFVCPLCKYLVYAERTVEEFIIDGHSLEFVPTFCYLGDVIGDNGGCTDDALTLFVSVLVFPRVIKISMFRC